MSRAMRFTVGWRWKQGRRYGTWGLTIKKVTWWKDKQSICLVNKGLSHFLQGELKVSCLDGHDHRQLSTHFCSPGGGQREADRERDMGRGGEMRERPQVRLGEFSEFIIHSSRRCTVIFSNGHVLCKQIWTGRFIHQHILKGFSTYFGTLSYLLRR